MIPIHELLSRIRWDKAFGQADFIIGYYDRVERRIIRVPLRELHFESGEHFSFDLIDHQGALPGRIAPSGCLGVGFRRRSHAWFLRDAARHGRFRGLLGLLCLPFMFQR